VPTGSASTGALCLQVAQARSNHRDLSIHNLSYQLQKLKPTALLITRHTSHDISRHTSKRRSSWIFVCSRIDYVRLRIPQCQPSVCDNSTVGTADAHGSCRCSSVTGFVNKSNMATNRNRATTATSLHKLEVPYNMSYPTPNPDPDFPENPRSLQTLPTFRLSMHKCPCEPIWGLLLFQLGL
jgi:hypothetical protein